MKDPRPHAGHGISELFHHAANIEEHLAGAYDRVKVLEADHPVLAKAVKQILFSHFPAVKTVWTVVSAAERAGAKAEDNLKVH